MIIRQATPEDDDGSHQMLAEGIAAGAEVFEDDLGPICFRGHQPDSLLGERTFVWFHPVRDIRPYRVRFLRACRQYISSLLAQYPVLFGTVDTQDPLAICWMKWLGFTRIGEVEILGRQFFVMELRNGS